jgi:hypothetical protein
MVENLHELKHPPPKVVNLEFGSNVIEARPLFVNASTPISVTLAGIVIDVKDLQSRKLFCDIDAILDPRVTFDNDEQP